MADGRILVGEAVALLTILLRRDGSSMHGSLVDLGGRDSGRRSSTAHRVLLRTPVAERVLHAGTHWEPGAAGAALTALAVDDGRILVGEAVALLTILLCVDRSSLGDASRGCGRR